jgi:hypothetical protein
MTTETTRKKKPRDIGSEAEGMYESLPKSLSAKAKAAYLVGYFYQLGRDDFRDGINAR